MTIPLKIKPGVRVRMLEPQILLALQIALPLWEERGATELVVTSCNDGTHSIGSKHWIGAAVDLRTKGLLLDHMGKARLSRDLRERCGSRDFQTIFESPNEENEHIHLEFDPQGPL